MSVIEKIKVEEKKPSKVLRLVVTATVNERVMKPHRESDMRAKSDVCVKSFVGTGAAGAGHLM